ncbi:MAG TPA: HAMP domain-containing sensor histidine kinase [Luteitalea sp.]|nr:HAMP domain-containing sensor histidine kinase [Luteitalea sp.]
MLTAEFESVIADRIISQYQDLAARWFERLVDLLPVDAREVFPTDSLLDHIPALILEIGEYVRQPDDVAIAANTLLIDKARELGALRHAQRASLHQVLREYQILNGVLVNFVVDEIERLVLTPTARESTTLVTRLQRAVNALEQTTVETFVTLYTETIDEQARRLENFTRLAAHEWRQPLSTLRFGITLLRRTDIDATRTERTWEAVERNLTYLIDLTRQLEGMARLRSTGDTPIVQCVPLGSIAQEAARQLREMAEAREVTVVVSDDLPTATVDVGRMELVLVNLLSNAIKYADTSKADREVRIGPLEAARTGWFRLEVRDNGVGIPSHALETIFRRFTRAHVEHEALAHVSGMGLGLAIVYDSVRAMGGEVTVQSTEGEGTSFVLDLPDATTPASA